MQATSERRFDPGCPRSTTHVRLPPPTTRTSATAVTAAPIRTITPQPGAASSAAGTAGAPLPAGRPDGPSGAATGGAVPARALGLRVPPGPFMPLRRALAGNG